MAASLQNKNPTSPKLGALRHRAYLVDNSQLKAKTRGLGFRDQPDPTLKPSLNYASWGDIIYGHPVGNEWVQVRDVFLPTTKDGIQVLVEQTDWNDVPQPADMYSKAPASPRGLGTMPFYVDNSVLKAPVPGLGFRNSPNMADKHPSEFAPWGDIVYGSRVGEDWVQVGNLFLPVSVKGVKVVIDNGERNVVPRIGSTLAINVNDEPSKVEPLVPYLVDNSLLNSSSKGLEARKSPSLEDAPVKIVAWGEVVHGYSVGEDFVRVGDLFLQTKVNGVKVLIDQRSAFLLDNSVLKAPTRGLAYRTAPNMKVKPLAKFAPWGEILYGHPVAAGWLQIGDLFLPMKAKGVDIVIPHSVQDKESEIDSTSQQEKGKEKQKEKEKEKEKEKGKDKDKKQVAKRGIMGFV